MILLFGAYLVKLFTKKIFSKTSQKMEKLELKHPKELYQTYSYSISV
jgi:hypothetical protein